MSASTNYSVWGSLYYYLYSTKYSYPITFISTPQEHISVYSSVGSGWHTQTTNSKTATGGVYFFRPTQTAGAHTYGIRYYVIGKWK